MCSCMEVQVICPSSLTNVKVWHGTITQVSYAYSTTNVMRLTHGPLAWPTELKSASQATNQEIIKQCKEAVISERARL